MRKSLCAMTLGAALATGCGSINIYSDEELEPISLQAYAEVMNEFAAGERYLNRVWSASVDGYIDEIKTYMGKARVQFERTQEILAKLKTA